jgi:adenylate kinase
MKPKATPPSSIVVTGTPGAGKTAVSKSLARKLHADYLSLSKLVVCKRLHEAVDQERRTRIVDLERTRAWLRESLGKSGAVTIIDTHVADAVPREYVMKVLVLRCHPSILEARLRRKGWRAHKVRENVLAEILDSCYVVAAEYYGSERVFQLDTSRASVSEAVKQCKALLKQQSPSRPRVDWITVLDQEGVLARYMS